MGGTNPSSKRKTGNARAQGDQKKKEQVSERRSKKIQVKNSPAGKRPPFHPPKFFG